jgi:hypothetical protein
MKTNRIIILLAIIFSGVYGCYSVYKMLLSNAFTHIIEPIGISIPDGKVLALSNKLQANKDTFVVGYKVYDYLYPGTLGFIDNANGKCQLVLEKYITDFDSLKNSFLPFACTNEKDPTFYKGGSIIEENILTNKGIKFNSPSGDANARLVLKLIKHKGKSFVYFKDQGIGQQYILSKKNKLEVAFNSIVKDSLPINYQFIGMSADSINYLLSINTRLFRKPVISFCALGSNKICTSNETTFQINNILFEITPRWNFAYILLIVVYLAVILCFQIFLYINLRKIEAPTLYILCCTRILFNCIALLALPLAILSITLTENRYIYFVLILFLNFTYLTNRTWLVKQFSKLLKKLPFISLAIFAICFTSAMLFGANESVFGLIPIFAVSKLTIMLFFFIAFHLKQQIPFIHKYQLIIALLICTLFLIKTHDFSLLLYTVLSISLIKLIQGKTKTSSVVVVMVLGFSFIFLLLNLAPKSFSNSKLSRCISPFVSPASLTYTPEKDRETNANLISTWKIILSADHATFDRTYLPAAVRSTAFSDYSIVYSALIGSYFFLIGFIFCCSLLIIQLFSLLYICLYPFRINSEKYFQLPVTPLAAMLTFLISITLLQFLIPFASQTMMFILTGVSVPILSISNMDILFIIALILLLEFSMNNQAYYKQIELVQHKLVNFGTLRNAIFKACCTALLLLSIASIAKLIHFKYMPDEISWQKHFSSNGLTQVASTNRDSLITTASELVADQSILGLDLETKENLRELQSVYFTGKPLMKNKKTSLNYSISSTEMTKNVSIDSIYRQVKQIISGKEEPFGKVEAITQIVNKNTIKKVSNGLYENVPLFDNCTINADCNAEFNNALRKHISKMDNKTNKGAVLIVNNATGEIITNASYPMQFNFDYTNANISDANYLIGSVKKLIVIACALRIDATYFDKKFPSDNGKMISMANAIQHSDDKYPSNLLKDLLENHKQEFILALKELFDLEFNDAYNKSYCDKPLNETSLSIPLNGNNEIFRLAIGQQQYYTLKDVAQFYSRIMSGKALYISNKKQRQESRSLSIESKVLAKIKSVMHKPFSGTANVVANELKKQNVDFTNFICKTGTAQKEKSALNSSSTFVLSTPKYTIAVCLMGTIPPLADKRKQHSKDLFNNIIPILKQYKFI